MIRRASAILKSVEQSKPDGIRRKTQANILASKQMSLLPVQHSPLEELLDSLDPDSLSPKKALELLYQIKVLFNEGE